MRRMQCVVLVNLWPDGFSHIHFKPSRGNTCENRRFDQQIFAASIFESAFHMSNCNILG